jgi:hypothetical protein
VEQGGAGEVVASTLVSFRHRGDVMPTAALQVVEGDPRDPISTGEWTLTEGQHVSIGRSADIAVGTADPWVSRVALRVANTGDGLVLEAANRNGAFLHRWGLPTRPVRSEELLRGASSAVRIVGGSDVVYWVLLTPPAADARPAPATAPTPGAQTLRRAPVRPLTIPQRDAVREVFGDLLSWPPVLPARQVRLEVAAANLGVSLSAVQARLTDARTKARALGLARVVPLTDPEYVHVLVRAGHLRPEHLEVAG